MSSSVILRKNGSNFDYMYHSGDSFLDLMGPFLSKYLNNVE